MKNYYVIPCFISAAAVLTAGGAFAQQCTQAPSCAELGFTDSVSDCADDGILYCPFDKSKVFCRKVDNTGEQCEALGYQLIGGTIVNGIISGGLLCRTDYKVEYCPYNNKYGKCVAPGADCEEQGYQLIQNGINQLFCLSGQTMEYCPSDSKYGKCVGEASCFGLGYQPIWNESGIRVLICTIGQTLEYCPSDNTYGKCVGGTDCKAAGYTKNPTCLSGQTKIYCPSDSSYAKCTGGSDSCLIGFLNTPESCQRCPNGIKANGYKTSSGQICYSCCSASEICLNCSNAGNFEQTGPSLAL